MEISQNANDIPEDQENDFHPSKLLLSAGFHVEHARTRQAPTNYNLIGRNDKCLWSNPMVRDQGTATFQWFAEGRQTPSECNIQKMHVQVSNTIPSSSARNQIYYASYANGGPAKSGKAKSSHDAPNSGSTSPRPTNLDKASRRGVDGPIPLSIALTQ